MAKPAEGTPSVTTARSSSSSDRPVALLLSSMSQLAARREPFH
jgi:hypothetical protein